MTAKTKLAQKRLTLLQLAEKLGNVSKGCQIFIFTLSIHKPSIFYKIPKLRISLLNPNLAHCF